ncbi:SDR family NAD(P)-dependent oxidoreductase [Cyclobacterium amurskyense]|uniref:Short-chain dehydrogenase/reductase SDR n=1 Tax=Cyclobacterium amurskyense TaxID=320787 RepID=A0A0H4PTV2_9BACT|nr:SDR family oxidoreductase [Cyclobacterium amurskyense]AKP51787.1 Short-chain dehydrogenase/reductase SDR [Cyclobacterium amurskyense]|tara:strand:+ start:14539 stop:15297 length:759 start_codon:yes stop_codon:yes gene_type:complete
MKGKNVLVTGGASGIGLAIVEKFAAEGATVYVLDFNQENGQEITEKLKAENHDVIFKQTDVSNQAQVNEVIGGISGEIDVLINNAGVSHIGNLESTEGADLDRLFAVNIKGVFHCSKAVIGRMKANGGGVIINMASIAATVGIPDRFAYSMSKGAVLNMTLTIARDYVKDNIRCNAISPARVHTPFVDNYISKTYPGKEKEMFELLSATQPIGRMAAPEEIASMAFFLASDEAKFLTGADYLVDGGFSNLKM